MKTFFEEYGLSVIIGCVICLLVVMASPVGGAINSNLKTSAKNMGDTGTEVQAKAGNSIKSMAAGENAEEDVPDTIFVGYNSQNNCLVFSHDENSAGYSACDTKYGDIYNEHWQYSYDHPWENKGYSMREVVFENKIKPKYTACWFNNCNIQTLTNVQNCDTSQCEDFKYMFNYCMGLQSLDISSFNVSNASNMFEMIANCNNLTSLNVNGWTFKNGANIQNLMNGCSSLQSLNISNWDTSGVANMSGLFGYCSSLSSITYGSNFVKPDGCNISNMYKSCPANKPSWY